MRSLRHWRSIGAPVAAVALLTGLATVASPATPVAAAPGGPSSPAPGANAPAAQSQTVTLITGDVVQLDTGADGKQHATVVSAADPRGGIHTFTSGGEVYVEPASASPLLASGMLDEQLFNVSSLARQGYNDERRNTLPLIVSYRGGAAGLAPKAAPAGSRKQGVLASAHALAVTETKSEAKSFWAGVAGAQTTTLSGGISKIWLDAQVHATLDQSVPQIGAPAAWARGYDGTGVKIAVLDSGIDATHPDFAGRIDETQDFTGSGNVVDGAGHGTHVASIAAGTGAASDGRYRGVAPAAHLMIGKVLDDTAEGQESWIIAGMQWAAESGADVANLSLGGPVTKGDDPMSQALDALTAEYHTTFVVAAGNTHPDEAGTSDVTSPGAAAAAITVGAVSKSDGIYAGSREGLMGDAYVKPDIMAPGVNITAAQAAGTGSDAPYVSKTGTSMAAPHVAGSVALVKQEHPTWGPEQLKAALTSTANPLHGESVFRIGAGRVDVDRATRQRVFVDQGLLDLGYFARPYDPATLHPTRTLTYTNDSDAPVTLHLAATVSGKLSGPAPAGVLTVSPDTLTIAPGAKEQAEVALDAATATADEYSGRVTATGEDGLDVDTAIGFYKQNDTVDVTFRALDRHGEPGTARLRVAPYLHNDGRYYPDNIYLSPSQTEWTLRLPEGDYNLFGLISTFDASGRWVEQDSIVGNPKLEVRAPNFTVTLDARTARPVSLSTPKKSTPHSITLDWSRGDPGNPVQTDDSWYWDQADGEPTEVLVAPTERVDDAQFAVTTTWDAGVPLLETRVDGQGVDEPLDAVFTGGPYIEGRHQYPVADAGTATPEDLQRVDVSGKVALVRESADLPYDTQVQNAADAGAAVVALYSAQPGVFYPYSWGPVPIIALTQAQGSWLRTLAAGRDPAQLQFTGTPRTPYAYDLTFTEKQQVGSRLAYRVTPQDLAQVDARIYTTGTGERGWRYHQSVVAQCDCTPPVVSDYVPSTGYTRTEYVTARPDITTWDAWHYRVNLPGALMYARDGHVYQPGQKVTEDWLKAPLSAGVVNPAPGTNTQWVNTRIGDSIFYNIADLTDSAGNWTAQMTSTHPSSSLSLGDKVLYSSSFGIRGTVAVPAEDGTYRLQADVDHNGSVIGLSTHTHTEWTFHSASAGDQARTVLPLVDIDYPDVTEAFSHRSALDLANTASRGDRVSLHLAATHQIGSQAPPVSHLSAWVSYDDGATWAPTSVRATGHETFEATYRHPASGQYVSLKVSASDDAGNGVQQTLIRAYRLG